MIEYKSLYHAISQSTIAGFNKELKEYTDQGYMAPYAMTVAITSYYSDQDEAILIENYSILLQKTIQVNLIATPPCEKTLCSFCDKEAVIDINKFILTCSDHKEIGETEELKFFKDFPKYRDWVKKTPKGRLTFK